MSSLSPDDYFSLTKPCGNCPFRSDRDFPLHPERAASIADGLSAGGSFVCHKTISHNDDGTDQSEARMCAGARGTAAASGTVSQVEQIATRLGFTVPPLYADLPLFSGLAAWVASKQ